MFDTVAVFLMLNFDNIREESWWIRMRAHRVQYSVNTVAN